MKIFTEKISLWEKELLSFPEFTEQTLFFDLETTGFSAKNNHIYFIGCAFRDKENIVLKQYFLETPAEEACMIKEFLTFYQNFQHLITYNGVGFDLPFFLERCKRMNIPFPENTLSHLDLYQQISSLKQILKLPNLKQKTVEEFLSLKRQDTFSGGELITVYQQYLQMPDMEKLNYLKLHNKEDLLGMISLLPILSYVRFFQGNFSITNLKLHTYQEYEGQKKAELLFQLQTDINFPKRISCGKDRIYFSAYQNTAKLCIKTYQGELKFFYSNYKDYYYLPKEDIAIHKSIAFYVDKDFRTKAKAATCYSKHTGHFIPQYQEIVTPYFKLEYHDKISYVELTEPFTTSVELQKNYILHLLDVLKKKA